MSWIPLPRASPRRRSSRNPMTSISASHRRELRHPAPLCTGILAVLKLRAAPAAKNVLDAIEVLRGMNTDNARKPMHRPVYRRALAETGDDRRRHDRRYYELCALSELKNSLRSGDIWVQGSRQFKDFEDYLVPPEKRSPASSKVQRIAAGRGHRLRTISHERLTLLEAQLATVNRMAAANDPPDAIITESGLKITPLDAAVPDTAAGADRPDSHGPAARQDHRNRCSKSMSGRASPGTSRT